jgi:hypothetical protein
VSTEDLGHVEVFGWVTLPGENDRIAVVIEELIEKENEEQEDNLRILRWMEEKKEWNECPDWVVESDTVAMQLDDPDPRLPDAQRAWSRRQLNAIYTTGCVDGKGVGDED